MVYACEFDFRLRILVSDGRMGSAHSFGVSTQPDNCLVRDIYGFHGFGQLYIETRSSDKAILVSFPEMLAKIQIYNVLLLSEKN